MLSRLPDSIARELKSTQGEFPRIADDPETQRDIDLFLVDIDENENGSISILAVMYMGLLAMGIATAMLGFQTLNPFAMSVTGIGIAAYIFVSERS